MIDARAKELPLPGSGPRDRPDGEAPRPNFSPVGMRRLRPAPAHLGAESVSSVRESSVKRSRKAREGHRESLDH